MTKNKTALIVGGLVSVMVLAVLNAGAAPKRGGRQTATVATNAVAPLTAAGEKLLARYSRQLKTLQEQITKALPSVDERRKADFVKAYQSEAEATAAELKGLRDKGMSHDKPADDPTVIKYHEAQKAHAMAVTNALAPSKVILNDMESFLASDKLDARLVKCAVLNQATPRGLAGFAQQGKSQEALVEKLLANDGLMKQMMIAGGAAGGQYGQAMQIYADIQKASPRAKEGFLQRLALATSLEHAVPVKQSNPVVLGNYAPDTVDPVKRYQHFEKAWLDGELDPAFKDLTVWDYRMVVDSDAPDYVLAWGREMLRNYRPDHITNPDCRWRYVKTVKTDMQYGSEDQVDDLPTQQLYQNILKTGGVCGRRAWFGGFMLRSFGIPITKRPQDGHAALTHWTPDGWVTNFGAEWEWGWTKFGEGIDFIVFTQASKDEKAYMAVRRAQWIGDALGEARAFGFCSDPSGFWNGVALYRQRAIVEANKAVTLGAVGKDIAEASVSKEADTVVKVEATEADRKVVVAPNGVITIPAVACTNTSTNTATIVFMKSNLGGLQMHYERAGKPATFEYTFEAPQDGKYALSAQVVTVNQEHSSDQNLMVTPNDAKEPVVLHIPYTVGLWGNTAPVVISLVKGKNVLKFARSEHCRGLTIKDFTLKPVK